MDIICFPTLRSELRHGRIRLQLIAKGGVSDCPVVVCDWKWRLVWNRVIPWSAGYDSSCRDGSDLLCNDRRNGTDFYTVSDPCMRQLLCDVF